MKIIRSRINPIIKKICSLYKKKGRSQHKLFCAEGVRTISTLLEHKVVLEQLYVVEEKVSQLPFLVKDKDITLISTDVMKKISTTTSCAGFVGVFHIPKSPREKLSAGIVLVGMSDPGNVGTLIRTAAALNKKTVVLVDSVDPWSPKVVQASVGTLAAVNIYCYTWQELLLYKNSLDLCALVVDGGKGIETVGSENNLLVVGSEAHGLSPEYVAQCDVKITLPMPGNTESLNAAVAGSVALYVQYLAGMKL